MNMKKLFLLILLFTCTGVFAQNSDSTRARKHEIGFGFTNIFTLFGGSGGNFSGVGSAFYNNYYNSPDGYGPTSLMSYNYGLGSGSGYWAYYANNNVGSGYGVAYKYHLPNNKAIRSGIDFSSGNVKNDGKQSYVGGDTLTKLYTKSTSCVLKVGYQFEKQIKKIMVFGGLDGFYYLNKNEYDVNYAGQSLKEKGATNTKGLGVTPFGGVLFRISEMFSISTEARFRFGSYTLTNNYSGINSYGAYSGNNSGKSVETKFNPLGTVSFNIHL